MVERAAARAIFSPTTTPMLPPMKPYSMETSSSASPSIAPVAVITASRSPVAAIPSCRR